MATCGTKDSEDPVSQSTASSEDLLPCQDLQQLPAAAAVAQQQAKDEENLDDLLELLQDSEDESSATSAPAQDHTAAPPPKRARRLPGWMAPAAAPPRPNTIPTAATRAARSGPNATNGTGSSIAAMQMERAFEQDQAQKRRKLEDAKASAASSNTVDNATPELMGALVDTAATATSAARQPGRTLLTRALFPRRVVVFDVETTGFAQDGVIVEIGGVELVDGVRCKILARYTPRA